MKQHLICYDISHPKRLARLHRLLRKHALALQYSVFLFVGEQRALERLLAQAAALICPKTDDLRAYPLPAHGLRARLGKPTLPEGIHCGLLPSAWNTSSGACSLKAVAPAEQRPREV